MGYNNSYEDYDDTNAEINPNAVEIPFNDLDDDCNLLTLDNDGDQDGYDIDEDCDDMNFEINPGVSEIPFNDIDDDCNVFTLDNDGDQDGYSIDDDYDDDNPNINPGLTEIINNFIDDNCDGYSALDLDSDDFTNDIDCNDANNSIYPGATEIPNNGIDEDCDGEDLIISNTKEIEPPMIRVFPNPTNGKFSIFSANIEDSRLQLTDHTGRIIIDQNIPSEVQLDLTNNANGVYFLKIETAKKVWTHRLVKVK